MTTVRLVVQGEPVAVCPDDFCMSDQYFIEGCWYVPTGSQPATPTDGFVAGDDIRVQPIATPRRTGRRVQLS